VYLTVNYALQQFQIAPAVTQSVAAVDLVPLVDSSSISCPPGPRGKTYIGVIVVGCVLAVVLIIVIILGDNLRKQKKARATARKDIQAPVNPPGNEPPVTTFSQKAELENNSDATGLDPSRKISDVNTVFSRTLSNSISPTHIVEELQDTSEPNKHD